MAAREGYDGPTWMDMPEIDRVGPSYEPLLGIPPSRKSSIVLLVAMTWDGDEHALLYQDDMRRTFLRGRCDDLGLYAYRNEIEERECEELYGLKITRAVFSGTKAAYVLTDGGVLLSSGNPFAGQLGRSDVLTCHFGRIPISDPVVTMAAGGSHVLAVSASQVFAFGHNMTKEVGKTGSVICGNIAFSGPPQQVACGMHHSVILTASGQVWTCGKGEFTGHGSKANVPRMTRVTQLNVPAQEIGCTYTATYALVDGVLYGWGLNNNGRLGVDCKSHDGVMILKPSVINCGGGRRIRSMRCSRDLVVALTNMGVAFFWGLGGPPQLVEPYRDFPRELFASGEMPDSGGTVFLGWPSDSEDESDEANEKSKKRLKTESGKAAVPLAPGKGARARSVDGYGAKISTLKQAVTGIETTLQDMQSKVDQKEHKISKLQHVIHELQDCKKQQQLNINELKSNNDLQQKFVDALQESNNEKQQKLDELQEGNNRKQQRINELEDAVNCPICLAKRRGVVFQCGHSACGDCSAQVDTCHNCRNRITARIVFFL